MTCCTPSTTPCGETTVVSSQTCCEWPDPIVTFTSGIASGDISGGSDEVSLNDTIQLYSENVIKILTTGGTNQTVVNFELDFTDLSVQQKSDFCTLVSECVTVGLDTYTKTEIDALLALKEDLLTFDTVPTVASNNPVTSGGLFTHFQDYFNYSTQDSDDITAGASNLFMTPAERSQLAGLPAAVEWTSTGTITHLVTATNEVQIGDATDDTAKLTLKGEGNTSGDNIFRVENSDSFPTSNLALDIKGDLSVGLSNNALSVSAAEVVSSAIFKQNNAIWKMTDSIISTGVLPDTANVVLLDASFGPIILTLPLAASSHDGTAGRVVILKRVASDVSANAVTIEGNGAETIDGAANVVLAAGDSITIISDGSEWHII